MTTEDPQQTFDVEDALAATEEAFDCSTAIENGLSEGPSPAETEDALDAAEATIQEMERQLDSLSDAVDTLQSGTYSTGIIDMMDGMEKAWEANHSLRDRLGVVEEVLADIEGHEEAVEIEIEGETYRVSVDPVEGLNAETYPHSPGSLAVPTEEDIDALEWVLQTAYTQIQTEYEADAGGEDIERRGSLIQELQAQLNDLRDD